MEHYQTHPAIATENSSSYKRYQKAFRASSDAFHLADAMLANQPAKWWTFGTKIAENLSQMFCNRVKNAKTESPLKFTVL